MFSARKRVLVAVVATLSMSTMVQADGGAAYNASGCAACHGVDGKATIPNYPNLAGQQAAYTVKQLKAFQAGTRKDPVMSPMANTAAGKEQVIAKWLEKQ